jgi:hypothetical protein
MSTYSDLMGRLDDAGVLFNVREEQLQTPNGMVIPNKKVLINARSDSYMAVVSNKYRAVSNEEIFSNFCKSLDAAQIDTSEVDIGVKFSNGGARTLVDFTFKNEVIKVPGDTSETNLRIVALNSFDGSTRYITRVGGFRLACANGSIIGRAIGSYSSSHIPSLDVEYGAKKVVEMLQNFQKASDFWGELMARKIDDFTAVEVIAQFFGLDAEDDTCMDSGHAKVVLALWDSYKLELGSNAYALYNSFTDFISHKAYKSETAATGYLFNQSRLENVLENSAVFELA